jgi:hypothetical protein
MKKPPQLDHYDGLTSVVDQLTVTTSSLTGGSLNRRSRVA